MFTPRSVLLVASLAAPIALAGCGKKKTTEETQPPLVPVTTAPADPSPKVVAEPQPAVERITVSGRLEGLDDMFEGFKKLSESWMPDEATDPQAEIQALLLGQGFGPGFWGNLDLGGLHSFSLKTPVDGGRPEDSSLAASVAVVDGRKLIENMPQSQRPSPLGEGMWELAIDTTRVLMNEAGKELLLGFSTEDIESAGKLRGLDKGGMRLQLKAENIPTDDIDPSAVLDELPADSQLAKDLSAIVQDLDSVTVGADMGSTRDLQLRFGAVAPFHKLGLKPLGGPRAASTALEARLPGNPVFVTTLSWGDPTMIHGLIDALPISDLPEPAKSMAARAVESAHGLLNQIASDVAIGLYLDKKGQATFVMAADVKDDAKTTAVFRGVHEQLAQAVEMQATMAGGDKTMALTAKLDLDGLKVPGGTADRLAVKIPKGFEEDVQEAKMFLRKNTLTVITHVSKGVGIMAIGAGARGLVTEVAKSADKPNRNSLAQHAGLENLRKSIGGCQICMAGDPMAYFRFRLMLVRDQGDSKAIVKKAGEQMYQLSKLGTIGHPGAGVKIEADSAAFGIVIPQTTLFAPASTVEKLGEINDFVDDPEFALENAADAKQETPKNRQGGKKLKKASKK